MSPRDQISPLQEKKEHCDFHTISPKNPLFTQEPVLPQYYVARQLDTTTWSRIIIERISPTGAKTNLVLPSMFGMHGETPSSFSNNAPKKSRFLQVESDRNLK